MNNFIVTSDGSTATFTVSATSGNVAMAGNLNMAGNLVISPATATITHSGATSLTISSPSVIFSGGTFVLAGSSSTPTSSVSCAAGTIMYDTSYIYVCSTLNTWYKAALAAI
ncbi:unnamed protein product [Aphanomyces euteiches]